MIVQFGLRLKAFCADITDKLAIARMELGMSFQKGGLFEALVAAFKIADKGFGWPRCSRGQGRSDSATAARAPSCAPAPPPRHLAPGFAFIGPWISQY